MDLEKKRYEEMSKLSISNIAWTTEKDEVVYEMMQDKGFSGLEIAPTRIFPESPYDRCSDAKVWAEDIRNDYGFALPSMQSIWYGRQEKLFGTAEEKATLIAYTKKAIDFAETIGCNNLVFGCPRNRNMPIGADEQIAIEFFKEIGDYAFTHNTVVGIEANPPIYNTNYINSTSEAIELIERVNSKGFLLNLDFGTMIENGEDVSSLKGKECLINHVHISEPGLKAIKKRDQHYELAELLKNGGYMNYVSIEVCAQENERVLETMMTYVKSIFGD